MVDLQLNKSIDNDSLLTTKGRIDSMSIVHENLYSSESLVNIKPHQYLSEIINNILATYNSSLVYVIKTENENYSIAADKAISLGLIFNELTTNSVKLSGVQNGTLETTMTFHKDKVHIIYNDNGNNNVDGVLEQNNSNTLGLKIIHNLISQLKPMTNIKQFDFSKIIGG